MAKANYKLQVVGVSLTIMIATSLQTCLLVLIPIFRYDTAGIYCVEKDGQLHEVGTWISNLLYIILALWLLNCCSSFFVD